MEKSIDPKMLSMKSKTKTKHPNNIEPKLINQKLSTISGTLITNTIKIRKNIQ